MTSDAARGPSTDRYTHGHHQSVVAQHARRYAERDAAFLLPHLQPSMRLLDVGCGPGSITAGLARLLPEGEAVGVDVAPEVIETARELTAGEGLPNLRFEVADVYALPFEDASFDAVYAHQVLQHLSRPVDALREMRRVLRPGGVVGVRDSDYATMTWWPPSEALERWLALYHRVAERNRADADAGRRLPSWLAEAGFRDLRASGSVMPFLDTAEVQNWGFSWADRVVHSSLGTQAVEYGLATSEDLEALAEGWRAWAQSPDAFFYYVSIEAVGFA